MNYTQLAESKAEDNRPNGINRGSSRKPLVSLTTVLIIPTIHNVVRVKFDNAICWYRTALPADTGELLIPR